LTEHVEMLALHSEQMNAQLFVALVQEIFKEIALQVDPQVSEDLLAVGVRRLASRLHTKSSNKTFSKTSAISRVGSELQMASVDTQDETSVENQDGPLPQYTEGSMREV